jgi:hypothetical protein
VTSPLGLEVIQLVLRGFVRLGVMRRFALRRLLGFGVGRCRVRATGLSLMRLTRLSRMRAMTNHIFVSFGKQAK